MYVCSLSAVITIKRNSFICFNTSLFWYYSSCLPPSPSLPPSTNNHHLHVILDSVTTSVSALYAYARQCLDQSEAILKREIQEAREKRLGPSPSPTSSTSSSSPSLSPSPSSNATPPDTIKKAQQPDHLSTTNSPSTRLSGSGTGINVGGDEVKIGGKAVGASDEEADGRKQIQAAMYEAQQKNLILLQSYP